MTAADRSSGQHQEPVGFTIRLEQLDGQAVYCCAGELDIATAPVLSETLAELGTDVTLDFAEVSFLDSSGISVLAVERERLRRAGHTLRLVAVPPTPRRSLEITGLYDFLTGHYDP
jgi:anti-anti-sigma factor